MVEIFKVNGVEIVEQFPVSVESLLKYSQLSRYLTHLSLKYGWLCRPCVGGKFVELFTIVEIFNSIVFKLGGVVVPVSVERLLKCSHMYRYLTR